MARQFVLIMTDSTCKEMLGCYGGKRMRTPNLDRLAGTGLRYDSAYTCQPVCGPARSAIFSGLFPHSNGVVTNCVPYGANVKTIGERLTDNGIHCAYTGKWHLDGGDYFGFGICPEGWDKDYWYDMYNYLQELPDEDKVRSRLSETVDDPTFTREMMYAHRCCDRAVDFIRRFKDEDFLYVLSLDEPHGPFLCPPPYNHMYDGYVQDDRPSFHDNLEGKPFYQKLWAGKDLGKSADELRKGGAKFPLFLGCNSFADDEIGRVLDAIDEFVPDALVVYTADHGDMLGSHHLTGKNAAFYHEICNIPLIVRDGRESKRGEVSYPASHIDLVPTILDYFSLPVPKLLEGKSMLPQIKDPSKAVNDYVFTEFTRYEIDHDGFGGLQMMRAVTDGRYKLSVNLLDSDELYDLESDPYEIDNRINDESLSSVRSRLHDALLEHMNATRDLYRGYQWLARPWRADAAFTWQNDGCTRQRENEEYETRQLDYDTGLPMKEAVRGKKLY